MLHQENALHIYTDGSSLGKPRAGGIGIRFVLTDSLGEEKVQDFDFDGYRNGTNNEMELHACITALKEAAKQNLPSNISKIFIYTDSLYVADNYKRAMFQWPKTRWFLSSGRPVLNAEQWKELTKCIQKAGRHVEIKWIKGHAKNIHNKAVDKLAKQSAKLPYQKPLKHINLRRKKTKKSVEIGSIEMKGQRITIHIISSERLAVQQLWKYKYEVMSKSSKYYQNVDLIFSSAENFMSTGHIYFVKFNSDKQNPRVEKVFFDVKKRNEL
jgi:ribonuclease HI